MANNYIVALCGLSPRDQRLLEIVVNRPSFSKHHLMAVDSETLTQAQIAIVDAARPDSMTALRRLQAVNPQMGVIGIADEQHPPQDMPHWVPRQSLLVRIFDTVNQVIDAGVTGSAPAPVAPVAAAAPPPPARQEPQAIVERLSGVPGNIRALVVDDSLAVRQQLTAALERLGFACDAAANAVEAQERLVMHSYDITLLDVVMPGLDGYELCRFIKKDRDLRRMPVVMLTSRSSPFDRARGTLSGCDAYLTKPITWATFSSTVESVVLKSMKNDRSALVARGFLAAG